MLLKTKKAAIAAAVLACAAATVAGQTTTVGFVTFERGDLPLLLTVPHGGDEAPPNVSPRTVADANLGTDAGTIELALAVASRLETVLGARPYLVIAEFRREFIDANRPDTFVEGDDDSLAANEAYNDEDARSIYAAYHAKVRELVDDIATRFDDPGVLLDIHGQFHAPGTAERGTRDGRTYCGLLARHGAAALNGPRSIFGQLASRGIDVFPPAGEPIGDPSESLGNALQGGHTVAFYGACSGGVPIPGSIDCIQIESGTYLRRSALRPTYAAALADAIGVFFEEFVDTDASASPAGGDRVDDVPALVLRNPARLGTALASGDFNADGVADVAAGGPAAGTVRIFYGHRVGLTGVFTEDVAQEDIGATSEDGDDFGATLAAGDFDGDGVDDLAIGTPGEDDQATDDGMVCVVYGRVGGLRDDGVLRFERLSQTHVGARSEDGDRFGSALAAGDFDGDGVDDLAVGIPDENGDARDDGMVVVFYGSVGSGLLHRVDGEVRAVAFERLAQVHADATGEEGDRFGDSLATGDFDGDGFRDLAVGVPGEDDAVTDEGIVIVFRGSIHGLLRLVDGEVQAVASERLSQSHAGATNEAGDRFGSALAAGDFDGSGTDDLAVGVPAEDDEADDAGLVIVFYGSSAHGLLRSVAGAQRAVAFERLSQRHAGATNEAGDRFGASLAMGDFDDDGVGDLAVGAPGEDDEARDDGMVVVFAGSRSHRLLHRVDGVTVAVASRRLSQVTLNFASERDDFFGAALATGDFDGDGDDDLAVGTPGEDVGSTADAGAVYTRRGTPWGF